MVEAVGIELDFGQALVEIGGELYGVAKEGADGTKATAEGASGGCFDRVQTTTVGVLGEVRAEGEDLGGSRALEEVDLGTSQTSQGLGRVSFLLGPEILHEGFEPIEEALFTVGGVVGSLTLPLAPPCGQGLLTPHLEISCGSCQLADLLEGEVVLVGDSTQEELVFSFESRDQGVFVDPLSGYGIHGDLSCQQTQGRDDGPSMTLMDIRNPSRKAGS